MKKIIVGMSILSIIILGCFIFENSKITSSKGIDKLSIYVLGEEVFDMPKKESGLTLSNESHCNNGVSISWNDESWSLKVNYTNFESNKERTRCELYFEKMTHPTLRKVSDSLNDTNSLWKSRNNITKLVIQNKLEEIPNAVFTSDESENQDGSIISYVVLNQDGETYTAYLQGNKEIVLNPDSSKLLYDFSKLKTIEGMEYLNTKNVTNMNGMFRGCSSLTSLNISSFNTENVTDMSYIFYNCSSVTSLDLSLFQTQNVVNMSGMFGRMEKLSNLDLKYFNTSKVTDMRSMFSGCSVLTDLDLTAFDTSNVVDMGSMFSYCDSLKNIDISTFRTEKVTDMSNMFWHCQSLLFVNLSSFDTSNVADMNSMFLECTNLYRIDMSTFNTIKVTDMGRMFESCSKLSSIKYGDNFIHKTDANIGSMFKNCPADKPSHSSWNGVVFE